MRTVLQKYVLGTVILNAYAAGKPALKLKRAADHLHRMAAHLRYHTCFEYHYDFFGV